MIGQAIFHSVHRKLKYISVVICLSTTAEQTTPFCFAHGWMAQCRESWKCTCNKDLCVSHLIWRGIAVRNQLDNDRVSSAYFRSFGVGCSAKLMSRNIDFLSSLRIFCQNTQFLICEISSP
jgi:hypothetical protein